MNILKKIFGQKEEPRSANEPFWVANFQPNEYQQFLQLVKAYFDQQRKKYKIENGTVCLQEPGVSQSLSLQNLAQQCQQSEPPRWPELIQSHFNLMLAGSSDSDSSPSDSQDFDTIASCLAVRIWPDGTLDSTGKDALVYKEDLPGTISTLVIDHPDTVQAVTPKMAEQWGKSTEALFEISLANVRTLCKLDRQIQELDQGVRVHLLSSSNFFTASYSLLLGEFPELVGKHGTLFGIPHRHVLICYPIEGVQVVPAMKQLVPVIIQMFQEGPGSISPYLYWYYQGKYSAISIDPQKKQVHIPPEFTEMLNRIAEQAKG